MDEPLPNLDAKLRVTMRGTEDSPTGGRRTARAQGMAGFDPIHTGIVDCIIRCTHRTWD